MAKVELLPVTKKKTTKLVGLIPTAIATKLGDGHETASRPFVSSPLLVLLPT